MVSSTSGVYNAPRPHHPGAFGRCDSRAETQLSIETDNLIRLGKADVEPASRMLARAFVDYPLLVHAVADPARREREAAFFCPV